MCVASHMEIIAHRPSDDRFIIGPDSAVAADTVLGETMVRILDTKGGVLSEPQRMATETALRLTGRSGEKIHDGIETGEVPDQRHDCSVLMSWPTSLLYPQPNVAQSVESRLHLLVQKCVIHYLAQNRRHRRKLQRRNGVLGDTVYLRYSEPTVCN